MALTDIEIERVVSYAAGSEGADGATLSTRAVEDVAAFFAFDEGDVLGAIRANRQEIDSRFRTRNE